MPQLNEGNINSYLVPSGSLTGSLSNSGTLTGQIAIGSGGGTSDYNDLSNKPQINSVTLSGNKTTSDLNISYNDLDDKPTIPAALDDLSDVDINNPYQTDVLSYNESTSKWINHPVSLTVEGLSNVALTTPFAGEVLKISSVAGGVTIWRSSNVKYSEIDNTPTLATVATSGDYDDLTNKPTIPAAQVNSDWNAASGVAEILNKPTLATVATSGDYDDLINTPTIPDITTTDISSNYTFTKSSGVWEIHSYYIYKTGNTYQALFTLKGDGTAVAAGSDGCVYTMSTGVAPLLFSFFIAMVGTSFCLGFYNSGDSTWHFRPINAAVTLNANSRLNFSGVFIK